MDQDTRKYSKDELEELKRGRVFKEMIATDGWKLYVQLLNMKMNEFSQNFLNPPSAEEMPNIARDYHIKGTMFGLVWARDIVPTTIAATEQILAQPAQGSPK